jgi:hypothetical protein
LIQARDAVRRAKLAKQSRAKSKAGGAAAPPPEEVRCVPGNFRYWLSNKNYARLSSALVSPPEEASGYKSQMIGIGLQEGKGTFLQCLLLYVVYSVPQLLR